VVLLVDEDWLSRDRSEERGDKQRAITAELGSSELEQGITGGSGIGATSRNDGYQNRQVQLQASLAGRVVALDEMGWATVRASRTVILNGRRQELQVEGVMRSDDLMTGNKVQASLLADAVVSLNGKPVKASRSIIGKILGALWP
jgi:flagellar basal body L-ring protein FlgH